MTKLTLADAPPPGRAADPPPAAFDWDDALPRIQLALTSSAQASTGMSAYFLLFGRQLLYPSELRRRFLEPLDSIDNDVTAAAEAIARANLLRDHTLLTAMGNQAAQQPLAVPGGPWRSLAVPGGARGCGQGPEL